MRADPIFYKAKSSFFQELLEFLNKRSFVILRGVERPEESPAAKGILQLVKLASE
jgi:hypothetical protein